MPDFYAEKYTWRGDVTAYVYELNDLISAANYRIPNVVIQSDIYYSNSSNPIKFEARYSDVTIDLNNRYLDLYLILSYNGAHTISFFNGKIHSLRVIYATSSFDTGKVVINNVKYNFYTKATGTNVEESSVTKM